MIKNILWHVTFQIASLAALWVASSFVLFENSEYYLINEWSNEGRFSYLVFVFISVSVRNGYVNSEDFKG